MLQRIFPEVKLGLVIQNNHEFYTQGLTCLLLALNAFSTSLEQIKKKKKISIQTVWM